MALEQPQILDALSKDADASNGADELDTDSQVTQSAWAKVSVIESDAESVAFMCMARARGRDIPASSTLWVVSQGRLQLVLWGQRALAL